MSRTLPALLVAALALAACRKKDEVVVAAPVAPQPPAPGAKSAPPIDPSQTELPPGHPSLDGAAAGTMPQGDGMNGDGMNGGGMNGGGMNGGGMNGGGNQQMPPHGAAMSAGGDVGDVKVAKATGKDAKTIAEVFADRAKLSGKAVTVRGKVVKYNPGIMGKNWIHLRDGSGGEGTNDVTVTTQDPAARGDVVTVHGTVAIDQDIGMGGAPYPVIIQDAKVEKK